MKSKYMMILLLAGFFGAACNFEKPAAPSWDTQVNVPMIDRTYTVTELIEGESGLSSRPDGLLSFHFEKDLDTTFVGNNLTLPDMEESFTLGLDAFYIPDMPVQADRYYFSQLTNEAVVKHGTNGTIAPFAFNNLPAREHSTADLHYASLSRGWIRLHAYNLLPVPLLNMLLTLQDPANGNLILASSLIDRINAYDSVLVDIDAAGKTFPPNARWLISGNSSGSNGGLVPIDQNGRVEVLAEMIDGTVSSLEARIPVVSINQRELIAFDSQGSTAIEEVAFTNGRISVGFENHTPFSVPDLLLTWPQLHRQGESEPLQFGIKILPFSSSESTLDLRNVIGRMEMPQVGQSQDFIVIVSGHTESLSGQFTTLGEADKVEISVRIQDIKLDHFSGRLEAQTVRLDSTVKEIEISQNLGDLAGVRLADANLRVELFNTIQIPLRFQGTLTAFNDQGDRAILPIDQMIWPGTGSGETRTLLPEFTPQNSPILTVLNIQPDRLAAGGQVQIGDGLTYGRVEINDYIRGHYILDLPIHASWEERRIEGEQSEIEIAAPDEEEKNPEGEDDPKLSGTLTRHLKKAKFLADVENHLPMGGEVSFYFAIDSTRLFTQPDLLLGPITIAAAPVDESGRVSAGKTQRVELEIDEKDISLFQNEADAKKIIYIAEKLVLQGTGGRAVKVFVSDYIRVAGLLQVEVHIGDD